MSFPGCADLQAFFYGAMNKIDGGYILTARKLLESEVMSKPPLYAKLWMWMLMTAKFSDHKGLKRGQFFTSTEIMRDAMSYMVGYRKVTPTKKEVRGVYDSLVKGNMIGIKKVTHGMVINICNYDFYQNPKNYEGHDEGHHEGQDRGTIRLKEGKEGKSFDEDSVEFRLSSLLLRKIKERNPNHKDPNLQTWSKHIDLMIRVDGRDAQHIANVIGWCQNDQFWQNNILSTDKLRKQFDTLVLKMGGQNGSSSPSRKETEEERWNRIEKPIYGLDYKDRHKLPELKKKLQEKNKKRIKK